MIEICGSEGPERRPDMTWWNLEHRTNMNGNIEFCLWEVISQTSCIIKILYVHLQQEDHVSKATSCSRESLRRNKRSSNMIKKRQCVAIVSSSIPGSLREKTVGVDWVHESWSWLVVFLSRFRMPASHNADKKFTRSVASWYDDIHGSSTVPWCSFTNDTINVSPIHLVVIIINDRSLN